MHTQSCSAVYFPCCYFVLVLLPSYQKFSSLKYWLCQKPFFFFKICVLHVMRAVWEVYCLLHWCYHIYTFMLLYKVEMGVLDGWISSGTGHNAAFLSPAKMFTCFSHLTSCPVDFDMLLLPLQLLHVFMCVHPNTWMLTSWPPGMSILERHMVNPCTVPLWPWQRAWLLILQQETAGFEKEHPLSSAKVIERRH